MAIKLNNFTKNMVETGLRPVSTTIKFIFGDYLYESTCTFFTALPEGSILFLNDASHARASAVLQATEGTEGTQDAAESDGKCSWKIDL